MHFQNAFLHEYENLSSETAQVRSCARRGVELDPHDRFVLFTHGRSCWLGDLDPALGWPQCATESSSNHAQVINASAWTEALAGENSEATTFDEMASRSPGVHVLIAMRHEDFVRAFPIRPEAMQRRVTGALARVGN